MAGFGLTEFLTAVESDIDWREAEIRLMSRLIEDTKDEAIQAVLRRGFITLLYAHAEGGARTSLINYIRVLNELALTVSDCSPSIVASAWNPLFHALSDQAQKHDFFRVKLADNTKLHRFARHAEFVGRLRETESLPVKIDAEQVVDTESNVDDLVLTKILFRLGFAPDVMQKRFADLRFLRKLRNEVAHGQRTEVSAAQCGKYLKTVRELLSKLRDLLAGAITKQSYRYSA